MPAYSRFSLSLFASLAPWAALAETPPIGGQVFNMERNERIHYSCRIVTETDIECDFRRSAS